MISISLYQFRINHILIKSTFYGGVPVKRKLTLFFGLFALVLLLGVNTIQKIQSEDLDTQTVIIDKDGNRVEPVTKDETMYGG